MNRLIRYIDNEFNRNSWFFAGAKGSLMAAIDFIEYVLTDETLFQMNDEEKRYIYQVRSSYSELILLTGKMKEEIQKYKEAFCELFADC